jgi:predicted outer membrane lipoprotein
VVAAGSPSRPARAGRMPGSTSRRRYPRLGSDYYALMGIGLAVAFGVIAVTLPLLHRMTSPGNVRFE